jgi:tetratricopeptide (TPR) repeat protein
MSDLSSDPDAEFKRAEALIGLRRYSEALPLIASALERDPDRVRGWFLLARAHIGLEQGQPAVDCARRAVSLAPDNAAAHNLLSYAWEVQGSKGEATREAKEAVRLDPQGWLYWLRLADRLTQANFRNNGFDVGWDEARHAVEQARRLAPLEAGPYLAMGALEASAGNPQIARSAYLKALEIDPQNSHAHNELARLALGRSDLVQQTASSLSKAASGFATSVQSDPDSSVGRQNLELVLDVFLLRASLSTWLPAYVGLLAAILAQGHQDSVILRVIPVLLLILPISFVVRFLRGLSPSVRRNLPSTLRSKSYRLGSALSATAACVLVVAAAVTPANIRVIPAIGAALLAAAARIIFVQGRKRTR